MAITEYQVHITHDTQAGRVDAYILQADEVGQWEWLADHEFGPFDTLTDVLLWAVRRLAQVTRLTLR